MRLTSYLLAVVSIFIAPALQAQSKKAPVKPAKAAVNYKVSWGPDVKMKGASPDKILLYDKDGFYVITDNKGNYFSSNSDFISKFNHKCELMLQAKVETEKSDKSMSNHTLVRILEFNKKIYYVTREKDSKNKRIVYFAETLNLSTLISNGDKKKIYEVDYSVDKKRDDVYMQIMTQKDSKFMLLYDVPEVEKNTNIKANASTLDESLEPMWKKEVTLPLLYDKKRGVYFSKYFDKDANLYLITKVFEDDGVRKHKYKDVVEGQLNYDYHIFMIGKNIPTYVDYPFNLKDKAVSQVQLDVDAKGEIVACGFYGDIKQEKNKVSGPKGVFYTIIDPDKGEIKAQSYKKFDMDILTAGLSAKQAAKAEEKIEEGKRDDAANAYKIRELIPRKDGGATMVAEEYYTYTVCTTSKYGSSCITHYVYRNIIVSKINAAGEIEWTTVIPKYQHVTSMVEICSYLLFDEDNDSYDFFFNDHKDNLNASSMATGGAEIMNGRLKNMRLVRVVVNADGSQSKREIAVKMEEDDEDTRLCPLVSETVSDNEVILYGVDHKRDKFAKITFEGVTVKN